MLEDAKYQEKYGQGAFSSDGTVRFKVHEESVHINADDESGYK